MYGYITVEDDHFHLIIEETFERGEDARRSYKHRMPHSELKDLIDKESEIGIDLLAENRIKLRLFGRIGQVQFYVSEHQDRVRFEARFTSIWTDIGEEDVVDRIVVTSHVFSSPLRSSFHTKANIIDGQYVLVPSPSRIVFLSKQLGVEITLASLATSIVQHEGILTRINHSLTVDFGSKWKKFEEAYKVARIATDAVEVISRCRIPKVNCYISQGYSNGRVLDNRSEHRFHISQIPEPLIDIYDDNVLFCGCLDFIVSLSVRKPSIIASVRGSLSVEIVDARVAFSMLKAWDTLVDDKQVYRIMKDLLGFGIESTGRIRDDGSKGTTLPDKYRWVGAFAGKMLGSGIDVESAAGFRNGFAHGSSREVTEVDKRNHEILIQAFNLLMLVAGGFSLEVARGRV